MEVVPSVYRITAGGVNMLLIAADKLTLIDTGFIGSSRTIVSFLRRLGRSPEEINLIILTHNHLDHIGGLTALRRLCPAKVAAHRQSIGDRDSQIAYPKYVLGLLRFPPFASVRPRFYLRPDDVDITLEGDEVLAPLGGLQVIHTPGHTPGSISLYAPQRKLLIAGDTINSRFRHLRIPPKSVSTNMAQLRESVRKLTHLDFAVLCCGHGRPITTDVPARMQRLLIRYRI
ncbi:MAG: MBL fold metallo-hydrolase [Chloroflexi bacterium]|nr:MBL fold metallo-hydrolase [Chloroflexota bacterium]